VLDDHQLIIFGILLWAEYEALQPLLTGNVKDGYPRIVVAGLAAGFVGVAVIALAPRRTDGSD